MFDQLNSSVYFCFKLAGFCLDYRCWSPAGNDCTAGSGSVQLRPTVRFSENSGQAGFWGRHIRLKPGLFIWKLKERTLASLPQSISSQLGTAQYFICLSKSTSFCCNPQALALGAGVGEAREGGGWSSCKLWDAEPVAVWINQASKPLGYKWKY